MQIPFAVGIGSSIDVFLDWKPYVERSDGEGAGGSEPGGGVGETSEKGAPGSGGPREVSPGLV